MLRARFVRVRGKRDRVHVVRSNGSEVSWVFPAYMDGLPHDLVHLVVESAFGVRGGFWGRIDAGVDPASANAAANQRGAGRFDGFGADRRELLFSEALANLGWTVDGIRDEDRRVMVKNTCAAIGFPVPANLTNERIADVRKRLDELRAVWRKLPDKGALELQF